MKPQYINLIRDAALKLEKQDLQLAHDLMSLAHEKRPGGPLIKRKLREYQNILYSNEYKKLKTLFDSGELVIIPSGFRCYTKVQLSDSLGLESVSLPFDSGYFPPISIVNILKHRKVELCSDNHNVTHCPCIKFENSKDAKLGNGIKF